MKRRFSTIRAPWLNLCIATMLLFFAACAAPLSKPRMFRPSGFLEDYTLLHLSTELPGVRSYVNPAKNLTIYHMVMMDKVAVLQSPDSAPVPVSATGPLGNRFSLGLQQALRNSYPTVTQPGYGVLKLRLALTNVQVDPNQLSFDSPYAGFNLDDSFVEGEFRDSLSGELIAAFVAPQFGLPEETALTRINQEAKTAAQLSQWAMLIRDRMYEARGLPPSSVFQSRR